MTGIDQNNPEENFIYIEATTANMSAGNLFISSSRCFFLSKSKGIFNFDFNQTNFLFHDSFFNAQQEQSY
jgi:hypothetical protein